MYSIRCMAQDGMGTYNGRVAEERHDGALWQGCGKKREELRAAQEKRDAEIGQGRQRRAREEPEAGHRHWIVGSAEEGRESAAKEIIVATKEQVLAHGCNQVGLLRGRGARAKEHR
jgi:hypothetical protein